jgi:hypothetical protein
MAPTLSRLKPFYPPKMAIVNNRLRHIAPAFLSGEDPRTGGKDYG